MKIISRNIILLIVLFSFMGCSHNMYHWENYNIGLYRYYKHPDERDKFIAHLQKIIDVAGPNGLVPPGIYAEYGFIHYENKNYKDAIEYFQKEHGRWPESRILMSKMIRNAGQAQGSMPESSDSNNDEDESNDD